MKRLAKWYWRLRNRLGRWIPDPTQGVGFGVVPGEDRMSCGELGLTLDVEGRIGVVYISKSMWAAMGAQAGWITESRAFLYAVEDGVGDGRA